MPSVLVDHWELRDRDQASREEIGHDPDGTRHYRLFFTRRPVVDKLTLNFRSVLSLTPALESSKAREVVIPRITCSPGFASPAKVEVDLAPGLVFESADPSWIRASEEAIVAPKGAGRPLTFVEVAGTNSSPFSFSARALEPVIIPPVVVPRMLMECVVGTDSIVRCRASYWVESHGASFEFGCPITARWITGRLDGRIAEQVDRDPARSSFRLWFPAESQTKPVLLDLEYMLDGAGGGASWQPPELPAQSVVLQSLWELRLPWESTLLGRPHNWSDENQWYWDGYLWKQRSRLNSGLLHDWMRGTRTAAATADDSAEIDAEGNYRFLFSRVGPPATLDVRVVSKAWIIAACAGLTLLLGWLVLSSRVRFRNAWIFSAGLALLGSMLLQPNALLLAIQSAVAGLILTSAGLLIQRSIERTSGATPLAREPVPAQPRITADPSSLRGAVVGSDESTAIRVRVPSSTVEFATATPPALPPGEQERSSFLEPA